MTPSTRRPLAFLFDLDGVIIHSMPLHNLAWERYLLSHGIEPGDIEKRMHGLRNDDIVRDYFGGNLPEEDVYEHGAAKERLWREMMAPELDNWIVAGVREFIRACSTTPMAVASNAEVPNIEFVLNGAGLRPHFQAIVDGHQVERPKPAPDIYVRAASLLGVAPQDCVVFEDSIAGIQAGREAGARVVGVATTLDRLPHTDLVIRDFEDPQLEAWLSSLQPDAPAGASK
ncbi:MAG: HAD family phosphatase [Bryobacteraceae bacterium]